MYISEPSFAEKCVKLFLKMSILPPVEGIVNACIVNAWKGGGGLEDILFLLLPERGGGGGGS